MIYHGHLSDASEARRREKDDDITQGMLFKRKPRWVWCLRKLSWLWEKGKREETLISTRENFSEKTY